ncbi:hypothetical protein FI667_g9408, partial [Globisporangium splendens]
MRRVILALAMLLVAEASGVATSQNETVAAVPINMSATVRDGFGFYMLQYKGTADVNANEYMLEIVHTSRDMENTTTVMEFSVPSSAWTLDAWDHVFSTLEPAFASLTPDLRHLELSVKFEDPVNETALKFALPKLWSYGTTFVFSKRSLAGRSQLKELVFLKNELDSFPICLLHIQPPIESFTLEGNRFSLPIVLTTEEFERLRVIPDFVSSGDEFNGSLSPANDTCEHPTPYRGIPICIAGEVVDIVMRAS